MTDISRSAVVCRLTALALVLATAPAGAAAGTEAPRARATLVLDGERVEVSWSDGDSFRVSRGPQKGVRARLVGVNTLETFGPVQFWGGWDRHDLLAFARTSKSIPVRESWECARSGRRDQYGRELVRCPELERELVRLGHAMVFAVDGAADPALLAVQRDAQGRKAGMWAKGVPPQIVSTAHSAAEGRGYDRLVDTRTGAATVRSHHTVYGVCEEVCVGSGAERACFVYVPYERRHKNRPPCLAKPQTERRQPE